MEVTLTLSVAVAVTVVVPDTVALFAGAVICVVGGVTSLPVPVKLLVWVPALSVTVSVADSDLYVDGVKVTLIAQEEFPASDVPQLLVCLKSAALVPVTDTLMPVTAVDWPFARVAVRGEL